MGKTLEERRSAFISRDPVWEKMTIYQRFAAVARECPGSVFFIDGERCYTYGEVLEGADETARALVALGVKAGALVAVSLSNRIEFLYLTFALAGLGAVKVPVNRNASPQEISYILGQTEAAVFVTERPEAVPLPGGGAGEAEPSTFPRIISLDGSEGQSGQQSGALTGADHRNPLPWQDFLRMGNGWELPPASADTDGISDIIYTSGSTGRPKGVMLTHDMVLRSAYASCINRGFETGRRIYVPLPLHHVYGYVEGLLAAVLSRGSILVTPGKFEAVKALKAMEECRANDILSVPSIMVKLLQCPELNSYRLEALNAVYCSASVCPRWVWPAIRERLGVEEVMTGYGMSEVSGASVQTVPGDCDAVLTGRLGRILYGGPAGEESLGGNVIEYRVVDEEEQDMPGGQYGQLLCRGPIVTRGYYRDEEATAAAFDKDGWLRTGDVGYFDEDGYLKFLGRCNDIYKINGENVSPQFLDKVISKCEGVIAVETVGVPDEKLGWIGAAFVDAGNPDRETRERVTSYCKEKLAPYQVPGYFFFTDSSSWPHTATGKVQKFKLREMALELIAKGD